MRIGRLEGPDHYTFGDVEGIAVAPDGHVYVVDGGGPFLRKYDREGTFVETVAGPGEGPGELGRVDGGIAVLGDGRIAARDPGNARISVFSPDGEFLEAWRIRGGMFSSTPLRIEKAREPVQVKPGERENARERTLWSMRQTEPGWEWDGPSIPEAKPAYRRVWADEDGRVWVHLYTEGERIPEGQVEERDGPEDEPPDRWREPLVFDLFEPDGTYLGAVRAPRGLQISPRPVARGETVWAVVRDELDVPYVVRFRFQRGAAATD